VWRLQSFTWILKEAFSNSRGRQFPQKLSGVDWTGGSCNNKNVWRLQLHMDFPRSFLQFQGGGDTGVNTANRHQQYNYDIMMIMARFNLES